jgi:hypothetical protein
MALEPLTSTLALLKIIGTIVTIVGVVQLFDAIFEEILWGPVADEFGEEALMNRKSRFLLAVAFVLGGMGIPSAYFFILQIYSFAFLLIEIILIIAGSGTVLYGLLSLFLWLIGVFDYN